MPSILSKGENPYDFFTVRFPAIEKYGEMQRRAVWLETDIDYTDDRRDFLELDSKIQHMVKQTVAFFFSSDGIVFANIGSNFKEEIRTAEAQAAYTAIEFIEVIHSKSYGLQLDSIVENPEEKHEVMMSIYTNPAIKALADWALKYTNRDEFTLLERLTAFLCVEGIFFSAPFAFIFWLRKHRPGKLRGVVNGNNLISRDENLHSEFAVLLIVLLLAEGYTSDRLEEIFRSAVQVSLAFVRATLPHDFTEMNAELMCTHVKFVANRWAKMIGLNLLFPEIVKTPFDFMESLSLDVKVNFFENKANEYQQSPPMDGVDFAPDVTNLQF
jgi:ribonucleoside-diphosphate reductase beta chain